MNYQIHRRKAFQQIQQQDPYWNNVVLYLPLTGVNNGTAFTDVSSHGHVVNRVGGAVTSTSQFPALTGVDSSAYFDGDGDKLTVSADPDLAFGSQDFTIEVFARRTADVKPYSRVVHFGPFWNNNDSWFISFDDGDFPDKVTFGSFKLGGRLCISSSTVITGQWYYIAVRRISGIFELYLDGVLEASNNTKIGQTIESSASNSFCLASAIDRSIDEDFNAHCSHLRITKGVARDVSVVPTAPFPIG